MRWVLWILLLIAAPSPVSATPAFEFLRTVRDHIEARYPAKVGVDPPAIFQAAQDRLAERCALQMSECPVEFGIAAAREALSALGDAHTRLEDPAPLVNSASAGPAARLAPLGWVIRKERNGDAFYVAWVAPDGPAARAGVRRHDVLLPPPGMTAVALTALSEPGRHTLSRGGRAFQVELAPQQGRPIPMPRLDLLGDVALLQVPAGSGQGVAQAAHDLISQAKAEGARALLLDLRDNPGGGVECAAMASAFVSYSIVQTDALGGRRILTVSPGEVHVQSDAGEDAESLVLQRPTRWEGPLAILVNENTGSCSEAVAIQAARSKRAIIIGEPSVGVGNTVVMTYPISAGWRLVMTVAHSTTAGGDLLPARPPLDVQVIDDPVSVALTGRDLVLEAAIQAVEQDSVPRPSANHP